MEFAKEPGMKRPARQTALIALCAALASSIGSPVYAQYAPVQYPPPQYAPPPPPAPIFMQQDLDRMLAPIALYPDALLSQILMASTYPLEVQEAARWSRSNPGLAGDQAVQLAAQSSWDPSVQSLTAFPQLLAMMDENIQWTESLGEAFLAQQPAVMDTVQSLRQRAWAAGTLRSNPYIVVRMQGPLIYIDPAQPQIVYVPYYDPLVVYGPWWYRAAPPVRWHPWPGYAVRPGISIGFYWGPAITVSAGVFFGRFDWGRGHVIVQHDYVPHPGIERIAPAPRVWSYAPEHRRGAPYRHEEVRRIVPSQPREIRVPDREREVERPRQQSPSDRPQQQQGPHDRAQQQIGPHDRAQQQQGPYDRARQREQSAAPVPEPRRAEPRERGPREGERGRDERSQARPQPQTQAQRPQAQPQPQAQAQRPQAQPQPQPQAQRPQAQPQPQPQAQRPQAQPQPQPQAQRPQPQPQPQAQAQRPQMQPRPQPQAQRPQPQPQPQPQAQAQRPQPQPPQAHPPQREASASAGPNQPAERRQENRERANPGGNTQVEQHGRSAEHRGER